MENRHRSLGRNTLLPPATALLSLLALPSCAPAQQSFAPHSPVAQPATTTAASARLPPTPPVPLPPWPAIAPPGYLLAATHWTQAGTLWLLLRPRDLEASLPLRVCTLATAPNTALSLRRASCRALPDSVHRFTLPEVGFALDDEPIVTGPDPTSQLRRVGYSAETGVKLSIRGMIGSERRNGLTVEKAGFGRYDVMQVADGKVTRHVLLNVPLVEARYDQPFDPVVVGDQVGWFQETNTGAGWGWFFSPLGPKGLTPHFVGGEYPLGCARCDSGPDPILELGGLCCPYYAFLRNGAWSAPVHADSGIQGGGPRLWLQTCRERRATRVLADYGLLDHGEFVVELIRCTERSCEVSTVTWSAPEPASLVFAAPFVDDAGNEKVAIAWHNAEGAIAWKLGPIAALAQTEPRVLRLPHRVVPRDAYYVPEDHILVRDGVALVVFAEEDTLRILRVDVEGTVGSVDVDPSPAGSQDSP